MSQIKVKEFDVVKLKDGREGDVVHVYDQPGLPLAYEIEIHKGHDLVTVSPEDIERVM